MTKALSKVAIGKIDKGKVKQQQKKGAEGWCQKPLAAIMARPTVPPSIRLFGRKKTSMAKAAMKAPRNIQKKEIDQ